MFQEIKHTCKEVLQGLIPILVVVIVLNFTVIEMPTTQLLQFLLGMACAIIGMTLFLLGVNIGLIPMGELIGSRLPNLRSTYLILAVVFLIGFAITITEPDVVVLSHQIDSVSQASIPKFTLIFVIGIGIGFFTAMAILRIVLNIPIVYLLAGGYTIVLVFSLLTSPDYVPIAFDAGGVTTGPMTVPVILALGIGFSSVFARQRDRSDGFGLIGLASIGPIIGVMIMGMVNR